MNKKKILQKIIALLMIQISISNTSCAVIDNSQDDVCYSSTFEDGCTVYDYSDGVVKISEKSTPIQENVVNVVDLRYYNNPGMKVINSYKIKDIETMKEIIDIMLDYNKKNDITPSWNRSESSMIYEWILHNMFYDLGLFVDHAGDTDFNNNELKLFKY